MFRSLPGVFNHLIYLGFVHDITAEPIARQEALTLANGQKAVFSDAASFEEIALDGDQVD